MFQYKVEKTEEMLAEEWTVCEDNAGLHFSVL